MRKARIMIAGISLFALGATQLPGAALAARKGIAATAPTSPRNPPPTVQARPPAPAPNCYTATPYAPSKTTMTGDFLCTGKVVVERSGRRICLTCGVGPPNTSSGKCVSCKAGYHLFGFSGKTCCKGSGSALPPPK
jgi:hypothetical protein